MKWNKLPEYHQPSEKDVLVVVKLPTAEFYCDIGRWSSYRNEWFVHCEEYVGSGYEVTHWMELPELPKE